MKVRSFIVTTGAVLALVAPAAHAANTSNRLFQARAHTILVERATVRSAKSTKSAKAKLAKAVKTHPEAYQAWVQTFLDEHRA